MTAVVYPEKIGNTQSTFLQTLFQIVGASLLLALVSQIKISLPFTPVPITMQTFGMMLVGGVLGSRKGALAVLLYLVEATMGLPVLAGGTINPAWLVCPSAGFLIGMVPQAYLTGWFFERRDRFGSLSLVTATSLITLIHLAFGTVWLGQFFVGWENALLMGFYPFIPGGIFKLIALHLSLNSHHT